ncbi:hypothetical protein DCW30_30550 [Streptomyces alfalfae]|uniref:Uncharacterized protein n=2 Tax=Streptomyces alfalfae TaxID=1642299 RepID=A0ABM6GSE5_9ACTN|nr:hypothetical protein A7J05_15085 [Streptomyces alfalfae]AYA17277.1 hypothetical protein D3X13_14365 [Streptomyces fradiae]RXX37214.1 hypothetical protein DCW30_30550 [Streptomyces alfalfae]RZM83632.1 hypothetical protein D4104_33395 [Streptomyces alfalfae]
METARLFFGLVAAVLIPLGLAWQGPHPWRMAAFTPAYGVCVVAPYGGDGKPWLALSVAALLSLGFVLWKHPTGMPDVGFTVTLPLMVGRLARTRRVSVVALLGAVGIAVWTAGPAVVSLGRELLLSDTVAVFVSAALISVFGGGALAKAATGPVRREILALPDSPERRAAVEFMNAGRAIGLLERGLLFAFLAAGQPEAAALVLAAKSLARVPTSDHGKHASEYFLIGTLASVIASLAMSMAARSAVGLPVL